MTDHISSLERRLLQLESKLAELVLREEGREKANENKHVQNYKRLEGIEKTLAEIAVYFKIGRWVVNAIWAIGGTAAGLVFAKWIGLKP